VSENPVNEFETWFDLFLRESTPDRRIKLEPWFRSLYERHGAVTQDFVLTAWNLDVLAAVESAVALVVRDVHRTTTWRPNVTLSDLDGGALAVTVEGHTRGATTADPMDEQEIIQEIADDIQEDLCESHLEVWPICPSHRVGLHAKALHETTVWWCQLGVHRVATIGDLGA
jgi:hypothetical protein